MDALDRTFRHLLQTIQARYPAYLTQPFEVAELYQNILPYRHHRRDLGVETNQEYEMVLLQLLSGARDYLVVNEEMRERLSRELAMPNPDPGVFREYSTSEIALSPAAIRRFQTGAVEQPEAVLATAGGVASADAAPSRAPSQRASSASSPTTAPRSSASAATAPTVAAQPAPRRAAASTVTTSPRAAAPSVGARSTQTIVAQAGEQCRYCNGALPAGRRITFCPHCGQNLTVINCLACGTELELGWKFCTTCGRPVGST